MKSCPKCNAENPNDANFCEECGEKLTKSKWWSFLGGTNTQYVLAVLQLCVAVWAFFAIFWYYGFSKILTKGPSELYFLLMIFAATSSMKNFFQTKNS